MPKGGWIITFTGKHVYPFDFKPEMVSLEDIAHALSNICRFTGHVRRFYSVAEHSVHVASVLQSIHGDAALTLQGLLHDAEEAYLNDLSQPLKKMPELELYCAAGKAIERVIMEVFGLPQSLDPMVKLVDLQMLNYEGTEFFHDITDWHESIRQAGPPAYPPKLHCWPPHYAKEKFLETFNDVCNAFVSRLQPSEQDALQRWLS